jgi:hypothetical protein
VSLFDKHPIDFTPNTFNPHQTSFSTKPFKASSFPNHLPADNVSFILSTNPQKLCHVDLKKAAKIENKLCLGQGQLTN